MVHLKKIIIILIFSILLVNLLLIPKVNAVEYYEGFEVAGTIEIPKINLEYPVLTKVTKESLEKSVAIMWPQQEAVLNSVGNVVIIGHNYQNGTFFSDINKLSIGDIIYITDLNNNKVTYTVYKINETSTTDTSFYDRDTNGYREISLSTSTDDSASRLIVFARESNEEENTTSNSNSNENTASSSTKNSSNNSDTTTVTFLDKESAEAEAKKQANNTTNTSSKSNNNSINNSSKENSDTLTSLPYTGFKNMFLVFIGIFVIICICIGFVSNKYKNI